MDEIYKSLGWQGGTIHQVVEEIKRINGINEKLRNFLSQAWLYLPKEGHEFLRRDIKEILLTLEAK